MFDQLHVYSKRRGETVKGSKIMATVAAIGLGATLVLGVASTSFAQSEQKLRAQIDEYANQLSALEKRDEWGVTDAQRSDARQWLEDAEKMVAQNDDDVAKRLLARVDDALEMIRKLVTVKELENKADEQEKEYERLKTEGKDKLKSEIEELKEKKRELQQRLNDLQ